MFWQPPLYTFSRNKGAHDNGGGCGWSQAGMRKYDELYTAIKNDRKKSAAPTFNKELLKMFLSRRKKESARGSGNNLMTRVRNAHTSAWMYLTMTLMRRMITTPGILLLNLSTVK
jgi:hypothetical protein